MGEQYVGIDLHRRRSVIVRMTGEGEVLETVRVDNDPVALSLELAKAGPDPEVVLEATYGWLGATRDGRSRYQRRSSLVPVTCSGRVPLRCIPLRRVSATGLAMSTRSDSVR
jgi:hypothetical protein